MVKSYQSLTRETAKHIKLIMADVDGTLNTGGDQVSPAVSDAIYQLQKSNIVMGLVSGRTDPMLQAMAKDLKIGGPLIAENGAVARLTPHGNLVDLGYSRQPALKGLEKLKACYPGRIWEREDNQERMIDLVFRADGITLEEIKRCVGDVQVLDSTYILHLMQKGIDKGKTLKRLIGQMDGPEIRPDEVLVIGDSMTDLSTFKLFPESVLVPNPNIPEADRIILRNTARYISDHEAGEGFSEVALHIIHART
ncbi:MAG: HAD hydrolase family protein [Dehalococcoidia bacterium]|jgi:hydroxymethylpyrimidine pyrophosphatase-like HAD family hydrolase